MAARGIAFTERRGPRGRDEEPDGPPSEPRAGGRASSGRKARSLRRSSASGRSLPDIKALVAPRKGILALGIVLMAVNRVSGLVLPASTKFLIDDVIGKRRTEMLAAAPRRASSAATLIQGVTSFSLTQLLSKAAQRLIAELRRKVQAHVGRLPVAYYDANKTGALVSRIMSDVEGVRNLIGTGPRRVRGRAPDGRDRARRALQDQRDDDAHGLRVPRRVRLRPEQGVRHDPADLPRARRRSTPRSRAASRSRSAACASSRATTPRSARRRRLRRRRPAPPRQRPEDADLDERHEPLLDRAARDRGRRRDVRRRAPDPRGHAHARRLLHVHGLPRLPRGARSSRSSRSARSSRRRSRASSGRGRSWPRSREDADPRRTVVARRRSRATSCSRTSASRTTKGKEVLHGVSFRARARAP